MPYLTIILHSAKEDLKEEREMERDVNKISDRIHEIADRHVPIYYSDILDTVSHSVWLALETPEC